MKYSVYNEGNIRKNQNCSCTFVSDSDSRTFDHNLSFEDSVRENSNFQSNKSKANLNLFIFSRLFPKGVNCWFCNRNTSVTYEKANSWTCPNCDQYNGFNEDGDYNQEIPEQRHFRLNTSKNRSFCDKESVLSYPTIASNGFCSHCNRNQELKVRQLASFIPNIDENYDEEITEYEKQLEQAYQLCRKCSKSLKKTLTRVKSGILGTMMKRMDQKSLVADLQAKNLTKKSTIRRKSTKDIQMLTMICFGTMLLFSVINVFQIFQVVDVSRPRMEEIMPRRIVIPILVIISYFAAIKETLVTSFEILAGCIPVEQFWDYLGMATEGESMANQAEFEIDGDLVMRSIGAIVSIALLSTQTERRITKAIGLLLWNLSLHLTLLKEVGNELTHSMVFDTFMVVYAITSSSLLWRARNMDAIAKRGVNSSDNSFHRIYSELNVDESETSDEEESEFNHTIKSDYLGGHNRTSSPNFNRSLNTTKSVSPNKFSPTKSIFSHGIPSVVPSDAISSKSSYYTSAYNYKPSPRVVTKTFTKPDFETQSMLNASFQSTRSSMFEPRGVQRQNYANQNARPFNEINSLKFDSMRLGANAADSISNRPFIGYSAQPQWNHPYHIDEPTRPASSCSRSIIAPSRLCYNPTSTSSMSQSSWVAGGYWGTSPTKKIPSGPHSSSFDFCPIMSRTSSQTSGFGSQNRDSPDDSICDEIDRTSVCSEAFGPYNYTVKPMSKYASSTSNTAFGRVTPGRLPGVTSPNNHHQSFSLKSMGKELPPIPKGRLLKMWIDKNINENGTVGNHNH